MPEPKAPGQASGGELRSAATDGWAVGVDIVELDEIDEAVARFGERYLERVYTADELAGWAAPSGGRADRRALAACFAVKEATLKALGDGAEEIELRCVAVALGAGGRPYVRLSGAAAELAALGALGPLSVTLDVGRHHALAVVLAARGGRLEAARHAREA